MFPDLPWESLRPPYKVETGHRRVDDAMTATTSYKTNKHVKLKYTLLTALYSLYLLQGVILALVSAGSAVEQ